MTRSAAVTWRGAERVSEILLDLNVMSITFCLSEDRRMEENGLRVALCSIRQHCPSAQVVLFVELPRPEFVSWLAGFANVELIAERPHGAYSWNCKPHALLALLARGLSQVVWLDSDLVLAGDGQRRFAGWGSETLGVAHEPENSLNQGTKLRTQAWGLPLGQIYSRSLNSCILRVTPEHIPLLTRWTELLDDPAYRRFQSAPLNQRPLHMWSDQDVLGALVGSREFAHVPVRFLRTGQDVIHCGSLTSYTLSERLGGLCRPIPPFVHCQGAKPWCLFDEGALKSQRGWFWTYFRLWHEISPYRAIAKRYKRELGIAATWLEYRSMGGAALEALGAGHFALQGLPLTAAATAAKWARRLPRRAHDVRSARRSSAAEQSTLTAASSKPGDGEECLGTSAC
jgi:hypothetical protein